MAPTSRSALTRPVWAWALYDFGNSAFTTLVVTFIYGTYFTKAMVPQGSEAATTAAGTALWSTGITVTALIVALASPITGALADQGGLRKRLLAVCTAVTVIATALLTQFGPGEALAAIAVFVVANIAFELSGTFYNAFLPDLATQDTIGRVSGFGWGLGYVGGLLCMGLALVGFVGLSDTAPLWYGLTRENGFNIRATNLLVAAWMAVFTLPLFVYVTDRSAHAMPPVGTLVRSTFRQLGATFHSIRRYRQTVRFLVARLFFNDALTTIFSFGGIYAAGTLGFSFTEIMYFGIALNLAAGIGGFVFGYVDDRIGGTKMVLVSIVALTIASAFALMAQTKGQLWAAGIVIGLFAGPNQAASRSLIGRFVPEGKANEFFGFFNFSGKATSFLGPFILGLLTSATHSQRWGLSVVVVFFVVGGLLLLRVDEAEGIAVARAPLPPDDPARPDVA